MANNDFKKTISNLPATLKGSKGPLLIAGGIIAAGAIYSLSQHSHVDANKSNVGSVPSINRHIGAPVSQGYQQQIAQYDSQRKDEAIKNNDSFIPSITLTGDKTGMLPTKMDDKNEEGNNDNAPPVLPPATAMPHIEQAAAPPPPAPVIHKPVKPIRYVSPSRIAELERQLASHMNTDTFNPGIIYQNTAVKTASSNSDTPNAETARWNAGSKSSLSQASSTASSAPTFEIPSPGTIIQAHFISAIDSRVPGVVMGVIDSGPYRGGRLLGRFTTTQNNQLMISFSNMTVTYRDENDELRSKALGINAVAVDASTLSQGMADYVNQHMLAKVAVGLATSFMQGIGQAIQMSGSTASYSASGGTFVSEGQRNLTQQLLQAGGQSASTMSQLFNQYFGQMPTTIKINQYRNFALLFLGTQ